VIIFLIYGGKKYYQYRYPDVIFDKFVSRSEDSYTEIASYTFGYDGRIGFSKHVDEQLREFSDKNNVIVNELYTGTYVKPMNIVVDGELNDDILNVTYSGYVTDKDGNRVNINRSFEMYCDIVDEGDVFS